MPTTYAISELTNYISDTFKLDINLQDLWVEGEVSNLRKAASGHWYFTLKDNRAQLKSVMWRSNAERITTPVNEGDAVLAHGYVGVYERDGVYQLYVDRLRPVGVGDLYAKFEQLKQKLTAEGLFDPARKRPVPSFPRRIGVVTSPGAAAFQDVLNVLRRRFPLAAVTLSATLVQGEQAPTQIVAALERLNRHAAADVILVCRGGGSIEELWAFNDERVARAIVASALPVITGVGHETDFTIADFAADLRAPTPSAAAEQATPDIGDLHKLLDRRRTQLRDTMALLLENLQEAVYDGERALDYAAPHDRIDNLRQRLDDWQARLVTRQRDRLDRLHERLTARGAALEAVNPERLLSRGYALVTHGGDGQRVRSAGELSTGAEIRVRFHDGTVGARVDAPDSGKGTTS